MLYLYILEDANIYRYVIYLIVMLILVAAETIYLKKKAKNCYPIEVVNLCIYMAIFSGEDLLLLTVIYTLLAIAISLLLHKMIYHKKKANISSLDKISKEELEEKKEVLPIGFYLCITNIILVIFTQFITNYV